jgi:hypothetical protein
MKMGMLGARTGKGTPKRTGGAPSVLGAGSSFVRVAWQVRQTQPLASDLRTRKKTSLGEWTWGTLEGVGVGVEVVVEEY